MATQFTDPDPDRKLDPVEPMPDQNYPGSIFAYPVNVRNQFPDETEVNFSTARPPGDGVPFDLNSLDKVIGDLTALTTLQGSVTSELNDSTLREPSIEIKPLVATPDSAEYVRRLMEPEPHNARLQFRPGDKVKMSRPDLFGWVPVGAIGEILHIENPESAMASKGRHFWVKFDLTPFKIPVADGLRELFARHLPPDSIPDYHKDVAAHLGALDLEMIEKGANWNPGYVHPFESDAMRATFQRWGKSATDALSRSRRNWLGQTPPDDSE